MDPFTGHWTLNHAASRFRVLRAHERIVGATGAVSEHAVEARFDGSDSVVLGGTVENVAVFDRIAEP